MESQDKFVKSKTNITTTGNPQIPEFEPQNVIIFDLIGPNAHFRNIQTNSSSLSYFFPPPTTILGLIAGIIGLPRDSYYENLAPEKSFLALEVLKPLRKELHTVNYRVWVESGYTQIPLEIILPEEGDDVLYRIYFSCADKEIYQQLLEKLKSNHFIYPPYLGISEFLARTEFIAETRITRVTSNQKIETTSILRTNTFTIEKGMDVKIFPEYMRRSFFAHRIPGQMMSYFYVAKGKLEINVKDGDPFYKIQQQSPSKYLCRM